MRSIILGASMALLISVVVAVCTTGRIIFNQKQVIRAQWSAITNQRLEVKQLEARLFICSNAISIAQKIIITNHETIFIRTNIPCEQIFEQIRTNKGVIFYFGIHQKF